MTTTGLLGGEAASAAAVAPVATDADSGVRICTCGFKYSKANPSTYVVKVHESSSGHVQQMAVAPPVAPTRRPVTMLSFFSKAPVTATAIASSSSSSSGGGATTAAAAPPTEGGIVNEEGVKEERGEEEEEEEGGVIVLSSTVPCNGVPLDWPMPVAENFPWLSTQELLSPQSGGNFKAKKCTGAVSSGGSACGPCSNLAHTPRVIEMRTRASLPMTAPGMKSTPSTFLTMRQLAE